MRKVCFISMKGGTGKTTLSILFTYHLVNSGLSVLLVDMDPQGNATIALAESKVFTEEGFLKKGMPFIIQSFLTPGLSDREFKKNVIQNVEVIEPLDGRRIHLIPNFLESHKFDLHLVSNHVVPVFVKELLSAFDMSFDVVVMDCPPYLSSLSYSALYGSDVIVIPAEASKFGLVGVELILTVVEDVVKRRRQPYADIVIQPNRIRNTRSCTFYLDAMREKYRGFVNDIPVKETVEVPRMVREGIRAFNIQGSSYRAAVMEGIESLGERVLREAL